MSKRASGLSATLRGFAIECRESLENPTGPFYYQWLSQAFRPMLKAGLFLFPTGKGL